MKNARSELIEIAAELANGKGYPSPYSDDHPQRRRRGYWIAQLEAMEEQHKITAQRIRSVWDQLTSGASHD